LLQLQRLRVEPLFVLLDLLREDACEIVSREIRSHKFDLFSVLVILGHCALLIDIVGAGLAPIAFETGFGGLWSDVKNGLPFHLFGLNEILGISMGFIKARKR